MSKFIASVFSGLLGTGLVLLYVVLAAAANGYVFATLWRWYLVPAFGVTEISVITSIGIALLVGMLQPVDKKEEEGPSWGRVLRPFLRPAVVLAVGWMFLVVLG